jgi:hypothetical protein
MPIERPAMRWRFPDVGRAGGALVCARPISLRALAAIDTA